MDANPRNIARGSPSTARNERTKATLIRPRETVPDPYPGRVARNGGDKRLMALPGCLAHPCGRLCLHPRGPLCSEAQGIPGLVWSCNADRGVVLDLAGKALG